MGFGKWIVAAALVAAGCDSLPIPTSESNPPAPNAREDMSCMQDCQADGTAEELCHSRCAK